MAPLMEITRDHLDRGLDVFAAGKQIGAFDAVLAAATLANGATALVSADSDFSEVRSLDHVVPDREGVGQLLSSG
jgi:predicted nucleic acid-binding protein